MKFNVNNSNILTAVILAIVLVALSACASVPMASQEHDAVSKTFPPPAADKAGLYIFRNNFFGQALKKTVSIDGTPIGETANKTYFYKLISPGSHTLSTQSEFSDNSVAFQAEGGKNYYARQYMKVGVLVGGAGIEMVNEDEGKKEVLQCEQAQ